MASTPDIPPASPHDAKDRLPAHVFTSTTAMRSRNSQLDEGFSEETRSQSDSEMMLDALGPEQEAGGGVVGRIAGGSLSAQELLEMVLRLPVETRKRMFSSTSCMT